MFVDAEVQLTFVIAILHLQRYLLPCTTTNLQWLLFIIIFSFQHFQ